MGKYSKSSKLVCTEKEITIQSAANNTNINNIIRKAYKTGMIPVTARQPMFADFSAITDYTEAQIRVQEAKEAFMTLPADLRLKHGNNPAQFIQWAEGASQAELIEAGILENPDKQPNTVAPAEQRTLHVEPVGSPEDPGVKGSAGPKKEEKPTSAL